MQDILSEGWSPDSAALEDWLILLWFIIIMVSLQSQTNSKQSYFFNFWKASTTCWLKVWEKHMSKYTALLYNDMFAQQQDAGRKLELHWRTPAWQQ